MYSIKNTFILLTLFYVSNSQANNLYSSALQNLTNGEQVVINEIKDAPVKGFKEILVQDGLATKVYYISDDAKFLFDGTLVDLIKKKDLTEYSRNILRKEQLNTLNKDKMINFFPDNMVDRVTIFTDIDCGYCRKLHLEIQQYNDLGIGVSYLFFPRAGLNSESYNKAVTVWCSDNKVDALTKYWSGQQPSPKMCQHPITTHFNTALGVGVNATPSIVFEDGSLLRGYLSPNQMKEKLKQLKQETN